MNRWFWKIMESPWVVWAAWLVVLWVGMAFLLTLASTA